MDLRAAFVHLRGGQELCAELRFAPSLELRLLPGGASGGALTLGGGALPSREGDDDARENDDGDAVTMTLRRERSGCYVGSSGEAYTFTPAAGAPLAALPFELRRDKALWLRGALVHEAAGWSLRADAPGAAFNDARAADGDARVDLELVLVGNDRGAGRPACLSLTAPLAVASPPPPPLLPPGPFLNARRSSLSGGLEPIDENAKVALPLPVRIGGAPSPRFASPRPLETARAGGVDSPLLFDHAVGDVSYLTLCADADLDGLDGEPGGELTWFSAGVRVGVGVGLGIVLGAGLGVGILMSSYARATRKFGQLKQAGIGGLTASLFN